MTYSDLFENDFNNSISSSIHFNWSERSNAIGWYFLRALLYYYVVKLNLILMLRSCVVAKIRQ